MAPEAVNKSPVGIVADLPAQKKKPSEIRAEKNQATREEGNALFKAGNVTAAAAKYTECIDSDSQDALSLANRAECYLRARQFTLALRDADAARAADPSKPKALYKRAMALNGLGRYPDAVKTLKELLAVEPEDAAATNALAECEMLTRQAFLGDYDMPALLFGRLAMSFRRCADYVGPVAVARVPGKGRGVVVTKDVKAGDLLCVSSPLAVAPLRAGAEMALVQGLVAAAARAPADMKLVAALPAASDASADDASAPLPDLALFRRHLSRGDESFPDPAPSQETFARHCAAVVKTAAVRNAGSVGVYALPALVNHGCAPNACKGGDRAHRVPARRARHARGRGGAHEVLRGDRARARARRAGEALRHRKVRLPALRDGARGRSGGGGGERRRRRRRRSARARRRSRTPANKKPGMDRDGEKAASRAAAQVMDGLDVTSPATLVAAMRGKAKASHSEITAALAEWKRTKGKSGAPDPNALVELATWFDAKATQIGLDATRAAWARTSVLQVYANIAHCLSAAGLLEARAETLAKLAATLAAGDGASFEHCKQLAVAVQNARRLGGAEAAKRAAAAEKAAAATLAVRYGCGGGEDETSREIVGELLKHLEHAAMENVGEFCEAS
jgi:hypothetical protein